MSLPSKDYWAQRAEARMATYERRGTATLKTISKAYRQATKDIQADVARVMENYQKRFELSPKEAQAWLKAPVSRQEYESLLKRIASVTDPVQRRKLQAQAASGAYSYRISRLEALKADMHTSMVEVAGITQQEATVLFEGLVPEAYQMTMYDLQRGTGLGFAFAKMDSKTIEQVLRNPWSGAHYSARIWGNTAALTGILDETITKALATGKSYARTAREIDERMGIGYRNAERLVRTESTYMTNAAEMESYAEVGLDKYRYLATLDMRTSEICQELDGQVFAVKDAMPGKNMPPMHPNCRSTTTAYFEDKNLAEMERMAADEITGKAVQLPMNITYKDWAQWQRELLEIKREMEYNKRVEEVRTLIRSDKTNKKINRGNQNKHDATKKAYDGKRSVFYGTIEDAQKLVDTYHGTGEIRFDKKGEWTKKEFVQCSDIVGETMDENSWLETNRFSIHYGKKGTHIVPAKPISKEETQ